MKIGTGILAIAMACGLAAPAAFGQTASRGRALIMNSQPTSYLGIGIAEITPERAKALNMKEVRGAEVTSVKDDSPASKAGLKEGDVVLEYNGAPVQGTEQLIRMVRETPVGREVKIVVWRGGRTETLTATIGESKGMTLVSPGESWVQIPEIPQMPKVTIPRMAPMDIPQFHMTWMSPVLGITGESLGDQQQLADFFGVKEGVLVKSVTKNSAAEKAGIKAGDVIVKVGETKVTTTEEIRRALNVQRDNGATLTVTLIRNKREMPVTVTIEGRSGRSIRAAVRNVNC